MKVSPQAEGLSRIIVSRRERSRLLEELDDMTAAIRFLGNTRESRPALASLRDLLREDERKDRATMGKVLTQEYVDEMLTKDDQERLRTGARKGLTFGNHSDVIVWEKDHFEELTPDAYQARLRGEA